MEKIALFQYVLADAPQFYFHHRDSDYPDHFLYQFLQKNLRHL